MEKRLDEYTFKKMITQTAIDCKGKADSTIKLKMKAVFDHFDGIIAYDTNYIKKTINESKAQYNAINVLKKGYIDCFSGNRKIQIFIKDVCKIEYSKENNQIVLFLTSGEKQAFSDSFADLFKYVFDFYAFW